MKQKSFRYIQISFEKVELQHVQLTVFTYIYFQIEWWRTRSTRSILCWVCGWWMDDLFLVLFLVPPASLQYLPGQANISKQAALYSTAVSCTYVTIYVSKSCSTDLRPAQTECKFQEQHDTMCPPNAVWICLIEKRGVCGEFWAITHGYICTLQSEKIALLSVKNSLSPEISFRKIYHKM